MKTEIEAKTYKSYDIRVTYNGYSLYHIHKDFWYGNIKNFLSNEEKENINEETIRDAKEAVIHHIDMWMLAFTGKSFIEELNTFQSEIENCEKTVFEKKSNFPIYFYNLVLQKFSKNLKITESLIQEIKDNPFEKR